MNNEDEALAWGNSNDGSVSGLVFHTTATGEKVIYLGSVIMPSTEKSDIRSVREWGNKISAKQLREWADKLEEKTK